MLNKCLDCRKLGHRSCACRLKNLKLEEAEVDKEEVNDIEDRDNEEALSLKHVRKRH